MLCQGFSSFPWNYATASFDDGPCVLFSTLPEGSSPDYNLGYTLVHEVGHWLGLYHTYNGRSCTGNGDLVADTPQESEPSYDCNPNDPTSFYKDSCPDLEGLDPWNNFLDIAYDHCMSEFTLGQAFRMHDNWAAYREGK